MEGAKHINGGEGRDKVFLESGDGAFGGISSMVVRGDKLDVHSFGQDILLNCGRTLVAHYVQCRMVASRFQYGDDFGKRLYHGSISTRRHGPDDDCIKFVDVCNKHILHTFKGAEREGTGDVSIHGAQYGINKHREAEHILHSTDFLMEEHGINLGTCGKSVGLHIACGGCIGSVLVHVLLVSSGGAW